MASSITLSFGYSSGSEYDTATVVVISSGSEVSLPATVIDVSSSPSSGATVRASTDGNEVTSRASFSRRRRPPSTAASIVRPPAVSVAASSQRRGDDATGRPRGSPRRRRASPPPSTAASIIRPPAVAASSQRGGDDATGRPRGSPRRRRPSPPPSTAASIIRPPAVAASSQRGGDDATGRPRGSPRRRRPSPLPSAAASVVGGPAVIVAASSQRRGDEATGRASWSPRRQRPSPPASAAESIVRSPGIVTIAAAPPPYASASVSTVRAPVGVTVAAASSYELRGGDEATMQPMRRRRAAARPRRPSPKEPSSATSQPVKRKYEQWSLADEIDFLTILAELREVNGEEIPAASLIRDELRVGKRAFSRRDLIVTEVSEKMSNLKEQFKAAVAKVAAGNGGGNNHRTKFDKHRELYELSLKVWPELAP